MEVRRGCLRAETGPWASPIPEQSTCATCRRALSGSTAPARWPHGDLRCTELGDGVLDAGRDGRPRYLSPPERHRRRPPPTSPSSRRCSPGPPGRDRAGRYGGAPSAAQRGTGERRALRSEVRGPSPGPAGRYEEKKPVDSMPGARSVVPNSTSRSFVRGLQGVQERRWGRLQAKHAPHGAPPGCWCGCVDVVRDLDRRVLGAAGAPKRFGEGPRSPDRGLRGGALPLGLLLEHPFSQRGLAPGGRR